MAVLAVGLLAAGCGSSSNSSSNSGGGSSTANNKGGTIALLLPETKTTRYETQDKPLFEAKVKALCPNCKILYSNANQDAAQQQQQAEAALTQGAKVLVLDAVDAASAGAIVTKAKAQNVPVVSYDRLITNAPVNYYISFDNVRVGQLQGQALAKKLKQDGKATGPIVMINGAPTDNNAKLFKQGATGALNSAGIKVLKSYDTPDWSPDKAQDEMQQAITAVGDNGFNGVYAANDGTAGGAIAAMKSSGVNATQRPTTGQDAELAGIQRILAGTQYMTVYKAVKPEAEGAATMAVDLANGRKPSASLVSKKTDNGQLQVPSAILTPVAVTKDNIKDTVVKDGFWTTKQICTSAYASACKAAGLT
ncbi:MAG TPA: sugar ABC transporter substrate-binding protein [Solirubrobacteraceae bacterium]|nr:sugar ABC transporter substrate-binding protein [Solirubrobacteraceae bacterium]